MSKQSYSILVASLLATGLVAPSLAASDEELIKNAMSAAPETVSKNATITNWEMKTLKEGTNGFTCMPDDFDHAQQRPHVP